MTIIAERDNSMPEVKDIIKWAWSPGNPMGMSAYEEIDGKEYTILVANNEWEKGFIFLVDGENVYVDSDDSRTKPVPKEWLIEDGTLTEEEYDCLYAWAEQQNNRYAEEIRKKHNAIWGDTR